MQPCRLFLYHYNIRMFHPILNTTFSYSRKENHLLNYHSTRWTTSSCPRLPESTTKLHIYKLRSRLKKYANAYYNESKSLVSDSEYDLLFQQLQLLEQQYPNSYLSPISIVGAYPNLSKRNLGKDELGQSILPHRIPMLSLSNAHKQSDMQLFDERVHRLLGIPIQQPIEYVAELKYDGIALSLHYKYGRVTHALTRGNGKIGENVTLAVKQLIPSLTNLKNALPSWLQRDDVNMDEFEIRGEAFLTKTQFEAINQALVNEGSIPYTNARNLTSGLLLKSYILKREDGEHETSHKTIPKISFVAYNILFPNFDQHLLESHSKLLDVLNSTGFHNGAPYIRLISSIEDFDLVKEQWEKERTNLDFEIDGIVLKVNNLRWYPKLGATSHSPRSAIAWKFSSKQAISTIQKIELSVGRTGRVTPIAIIDPVEISGSKIMRLTMHNRSYMEKKRLTVGAKVLIERSGNVIPKILKCIHIFDPPVCSDQHPDVINSIDWVNCPCYLKQPLIGDVEIFCINAMCPQQRLRQLEHFSKALDIEGLGPSTIAQLIDYSFISTIPDIFKLKTYHGSSLKRRKGWGQLRAEKLFENIEYAKQKATFQAILFGLGIGRMGMDTSRRIAYNVKSIDALSNKTASELAMIDEIGPVVAQSIFCYFSTESAQLLIKELDEIGLPLSLTADEIEEEKHMHLLSIKNQDGLLQQTSSMAGEEALISLSGKHVVLTGSFKSMTKKEAKRLLNQIGCVVKPSISKYVDHVIRGGQDPEETIHTPAVMSKKIQEAERKKISILSERLFLKALKDAGIYQIEESKEWITPNIKVVSR